MSCLFFSSHFPCLPQNKQIFKDCLQCLWGGSGSLMRQGPALCSLFSKIMTSAWCHTIDIQKHTYKHMHIYTHRRYKPVYAQWWHPNAHVAHFSFLLWDAKPFLKIATVFVLVLSLSILSKHNVYSLSHTDTNLILLHWPKKIFSHHLQYLLC